MGNIKHITPKHIYRWRAKILKQNKKYQVFLYDESPDIIRGAISPEFTNFRGLVAFMRRALTKYEKEQNQTPSHCNYYKWLREAYLEDNAIAW